MEQGEDLDALFGNVNRYRPKELRELTTITKFSRREIQHIYRGFKQECPLGTVDEDGFKQLFSQFFPFGDAAKYAQLVFATLKTTNGDIVTFEEFLSSLSAVARGSIEDKIAWIFSLYDTNRDGFITRDEMHEVVESIYGMLGANTVPAMEPNVIDQHVDDVFSKMDSDGDGVITIDDMGRWCTREAELQGSLNVFNTVW